MEDTAAERGAPAAASLASLVDYQDKTVVSRTLLKKSAGTVTLFAFDEGEGLSEHTAPFEALIYIVEGEAEITISGQSQRVKAGEIITLPAQQPHAVRALLAFKMLLIMIRS